ncbi:LPS-assembly lipoprotein [Idiomarina aquatica]|uniref:LPS-assembly lipoprotein LptE n=2 Tax=Idiomarinaceae TaxID=267893 RepID=A0A4R6PMH6_9GAMM|nr:LPS-assembly lipoprotein [Idiomarina aquatica]
MSSFRLMRQSLLSVIVMITLSACGFQLRDNYQLPATLQQMQLQSVSSLQLEASLRQRLLTAGIQLSDQAAADVAQLRVLSDQLERRTLSLFESGQVAEYELLYRVNYQVIRNGELIIEDTIEVARDYQDDPNFALAKTREREMLVAEMRDDAARRLVRQMISEFADD